MFLLRNQLTVLWEFPCRQLIAFLLLLLRFSLYLYLWHFNYAWSGLLCIHFAWDSLCFLHLNVYFLCQIREVFFIIFSNRFLISFSCPSDTPMMQMLECLKLSQRLLILFSFLRGILFSSYCSDW